MNFSPVEVWNILLIDDDEDDYLLTRTLLRQAQSRKIHLEWAPTYQAGRDMLRTNQYQAVLVDYDLGSHTGIELIRETAERGYPAPLILFTGRGSYEVDLEAMQAGATLYITKTEVTPLLFERSIRYAIERKRIEDELDRRLKERTDILESIRDGFLSIDRDWKIKYVNSHAALAVGKTPQDLIGQDLWETYPRFLGTIIEKNYRLAMQERKSVQYETRGKYIDHWYIVSIYPSEEGITVYWHDTTDRKVAEQAQHESETLLHLALAGAQAGLWEWDIRTNQGNLSPEMCALLGLDPSNPLLDLQTYLDMLHPDDWEATQAKFLSTIEQKKPTVLIETRFICPDGKMIWLSGLGQIEYDEAGQPVRVYGIHQDVTQRKQTEAALRESEERLRLALRSSRQGIWEFDLTKKTLIWDENAKAIYGLSPETPVTPKLHIDAIHPDDRERVRRAIQTAIQNQGEFESENRVIWPDGSLHWVLTLGRAYQNQATHSVWMIGTMLDITERKQAEEGLQRYAEELKRSNQALEDFAFIASHDLREPLRKIQSFGNSLLASTGQHLPEDSHDYIKRMQQAAERMQSMLDGLLAYSRASTQGLSFTKVDLHQVATEVLSDLETRIVDVDGSVEVGELPEIEADPVQMRQLIQNLVANALKFHRPDIHPQIKIYGLDGPDNSVDVVVEDNGIGIDLRHVDYLFHPFHRLHGKSAYEGTGMGLAICQRIVERHRGSISVDSEPGKGSKFTVHLPRFLIA